MKEIGYLNPDISKRLELPDDEFISIAKQIISDAKEAGNYDTHRGFHSFDGQTSNKEFYFGEEKPGKFLYKTNEMLPFYLKYYRSYFSSEEFEIIYSYKYAPIDKGTIIKGGTLFGI